MAMWIMWATYLLCVICRVACKIRGRVLKNDTLLSKNDNDNAFWWLFSEIMVGVVVGLLVARAADNAAMGWSWFGISILTAFLAGVTRCNLPYWIEAGMVPSVGKRRKQVTKLDGHKGRIEAKIKQLPDGNEKETLRLELSKVCGKIATLEREIEEERAAFTLKLQQNETRLLVAQAEAAISEDPNRSDLPVVSQPESFATSSQTDDEPAFVQARTI